jgi:hypothetical protein
MATNRIIADFQSGKTTEETVANLMSQMIRILDQINQASLAIVIGPNDELPEGLNVGQPVIDWRTGTTVVKVWNGSALV